MSRGFFFFWTNQTQNNSSLSSISLFYSWFWSKFVFGELERCKSPIWRLDSAGVLLIQNQDQRQNKQMMSGLNRLMFFFFIENFLIILESEKKIKDRKKNSCGPWTLILVVVSELLSHWWETIRPLYEGLPTHFELKLHLLVMKTKTCGPDWSVSWFHLSLILWLYI